MSAYSYGESTKEAQESVFTSIRVRTDLNLLAGTVITNTKSDRVASPSLRTIALVCPIVRWMWARQTAFSWEELALALSKAGYFAVGLELRGHGDTDWAPAPKVNSPSLRAELACRLL